MLKGRHRHSLLGVIRGNPNFWRGQVVSFVFSKKEEDKSEVCGRVAPFLFSKEKENKSEVCGGGGSKRRVLRKDVKA